jgi:hypothetical protein
MLYFITYSIREQGSCWEYLQLGMTSSARNLLTIPETAWFLLLWSF